MKVVAKGRYARVSIFCNKANFFRTSALIQCTFFESNSLWLFATSLQKLLHFSKVFLYAQDVLSTQAMRETKHIRD